MYLLIGPAVAVVGIVAVFFVMRHKSVQTRSMYSSRRSQIERKVKAARQRTLAPKGHGAPPTDQEIAAAAMAPPVAPAQPAYQAQAPAYPPPAPAAPAERPQPVWDVGPAPAPAPAPAVPPPAPAPPPASPFEPMTPAAEPAWTPLPAEPAWTPTPLPAPVEPLTPAPPPAPQVPAPAPAQAAEPLTPVANASWSIVGETKAEAEEAPTKDKDKRKGAQPAGAAWQLASGEVPDDEGTEEVKKPSAALAVAQYAVLVVGLVMVLIGVLVMVANSKVT